MKSARKKSSASEGRAAARPASLKTRVKPDARKRVPPTRPFVMVTFAMTVDGKVTTKSFSPIDFTSREDKTHLFQQRALGDAVLIGHSTLKHDNVRLGIADPKMRADRIVRGQAPAPLRVIISNEGRIDPSLKIFNADPAKTGPILIFSTTRMPTRLQKILRQKATLHLSASKTVDLGWMLQQLLRDYGVRKVACEGGATLFRALLEADLVDQLNLTIAPFLFGGANAPTLTGLSREFLPRSIQCKLTDMRVVREECFLTYRIKRRK
jgi:5-amino-6-(5-phosphoribosylamino)uracil reductase